MRTALRRKFIASIAAVLGWAAFVMPGVAGGGEPTERRLRLSVWGQPLAEVERQFSEQADITLSASRTLRDHADLPRRPLYLLTDGVAQSEAATVRTALELLARALGCRYHLPEDGRATLVSGYDWIRDDETPKPLFVVNPDQEWRRPGDDPRRARARLHELAKAVPLYNNPYCMFDVRDAVVGGDGQTQRQLNATLPATHHRLVERALALGGAPPTPRPAPPDAAPPRAVDRLAIAVHADYADRSVRDILQAIALQTGLVIGFDHEPFVDAPPPVIARLALGRVDARTALVELSRLMGLGGAHSPWPGVVWLTGDWEGWREEPPASRELLWRSLAVDAFEAAGAIPPDDARPAPRDGDDLAARLRRTVTPGVWDDPMAALVFNPRRQSLVAVAPPDTLAALARELDRLARAIAERGDWPADTAEATP